MGGVVDDGDDDDDDEDDTPGGEVSGRAETIERDALPASVERSDIVGTSVAPEVRHRRSPPHVPAETALVTLQSLHDLLLEKRVARQRLEDILLEERAAQLRMETMLHEEAASRRRLIDGIEELAGYYLLLHPKPLHHVL